MEGRYPKGVLVALSNSKPPVGEEEFNAWCSQVYLPLLTASGTFHHAQRYRDTRDQLEPGDGRFLDVLETDSDDLRGAKLEFDQQVSQLEKKMGKDFPMDIVFSGVLRATGPEFRLSPGPSSVTGLMILFANCKVEAKDKEFNDWYNQVHIPHVVAGGSYHTAYRYQSMDPQSKLGKYLAIYETDNPDPGGLSEAVARERPTWITEGLYTPDIERVLRTAYTRI